MSRSSLARTVTVLVAAILGVGCTSGTPYEPPVLPTCVPVDSLRVDTLRAGGIAVVRYCVVVILPPTK